MKHKDIATQSDLDDIDRAKAMVIDGKALRKRVMTRLRVRALRKRKVT